MGGNVTMCYNKLPVTPDKLNLSQISRVQFCKDFDELMKFLRFWPKVNNNFEMYNYSGSTKHLFDAKIHDDELLRYKPIFGDIDLKVDEKINDNGIRKVLNGYVGTYITPKFFYYGYKESPGTLINLFKYNNEINLQVDFEWYDLSSPNKIEFANFASNSDWGDVQLEIKGVFHKLLFGAIDHGTNQINSNLLWKYDKYEKLKNHKYAFSVKHGIREKYKRISSNAIYIEISEKNYIYNVKEMVQIIFNDIFNDTIIRNFAWSFHGLLELMKTKLFNEQIQLIFDAFTERIFSEKSQILSKDKYEDFTIKYNAITYFMATFSYLHINKNILAERYK